MTENTKLLAWVEEIQILCKPDRVYWCNGSQEEYHNIMQSLVQDGLATPLAKRPNSYLFRSDPSDVARVEDRTIIATRTQQDAGPTNHWVEPEALKKEMRGLFDGCMRGRTMYIIPFCMGPIGSAMSKIGVEITDSGYVVANMHITTHTGTQVLDMLGKDGDFVPCLHSVGKPLAEGQSDNGVWPCAPLEDKYIVQFPEEKTVWSYGSGYGGNALLGKKCLALRIASYLAKTEGWMAEHMLIMRLTSPEGRRYHIVAAFPSACGKTNLAMLQPTLPGWKCETLGDDIAWMHIGKDGRLYAVNPEAGFFGVAPGTNWHSNPIAMETIRKNTIFTNCVLTDDGDIWWEGMDTPISHGIDWQGHDWTPESGQKGAHPNARFTVPAEQCPIISPDWQNPEGVPVDIIIFGGRRNTVVPLVTEAFNWDHGVYMGAVCTSEPTAAALDVTSLRHDPFAMLPFCGYNMADYWAHWFKMGDKLGNKVPRIYTVNWFRKSMEGEYLWPGYGDNSRVLKWMCERVDGKAHANDTPIGRTPLISDLDLSDLEISTEVMETLLAVDVDAWRKELPEYGEYMSQFGDRLPKRMSAQLQRIQALLEEKKENKNEKEEALPI